MYPIRKCKCGESHECSRLDPKANGKLRHTIQGRPIGKTADFESANTRSSRVPEKVTEGNQRIGDKEPSVMVSAVGKAGVAGEPTQGRTRQLNRLSTESQVRKPPRAVSVAEIEEIPAVPQKKPRPTDVCLHGMEYRFCRVFLCKAMVA